MTGLQRLKEQGRNQGIKLGKQEGIKLGKQEGKKELLKNLIKKGIITKEQAQKFTPSEPKS